MVLFVLHDKLIAAFTDDKAVIAIGGEWLSILSYSYFVYGWWMVSVQAFNGAGDTATPTWINLVFFWLIQIPLAWALALPMGWAHSGVFWGVFVSETAVGLFTLWLFGRGHWKTVKVLGTNDKACQLARPLASSRRWAPLDPLPPCSATHGDR